MDETRLRPVKDWIQDLWACPVVSGLRPRQRTIESCGLVPPRIRFVQVLDRIGFKENTDQVDMSQALQWWVIRVKGHPNECQDPKFPSRTWALMRWWMCFTSIASPSKVVADQCMNMAMKEVFSVVALLQTWIFRINLKSDYVWLFWSWFCLGLNPSMPRSQYTLVLFTTVLV